MFTAAPSHDHATGTTGESSRQRIFPTQSHSWLNGRTIILPTELAASAVLLTGLFPEEWSEQRDKFVHQVFLFLRTDQTID
jgi:hypothetical protein